MTKREHIKRHRELHRHLDELIADFVTMESVALSATSLSEFLKWSYEQTRNPRTRPLLGKML